MAANVVEATLRSKYEDGIEAGVENTRKLMQSAFSSMKDGGAAAAAGVEAAFESTVGALESWRSGLLKAADDSDSSFKKMSLGAAAFGIAAVEVFLRASQAAADFALETIKEASEYFQVKQSFDALTAAAGAQANILGELRKATEGQISSTTLMSNASRVFSAQLPLTSAQYLQLVENVGRLAKSQGKDAVEAQNALTEALIRGQSRGLGPAIGVHLAVRDAVSAMAAEMDVNASKIADSSKLTAFYNELLDKTEQSIKLLPPSYLTLEEVMTAAKNTQKDLTNEFGSAVLHSAVLQDLLGKLQESLLGLSVSGEKENAVALATNDALISVLRTVASLAANVAFFGPIWENVWAAAKAIFFAFLNVFAGLGAILLDIIGRMVGVLGYVSGKFGEAAQWIGKFEDKLRSVAGFAHDGFNNSFDGVGDTAKRFSDLAGGASKLADEMEKLRGKTIDSTGALKKQGKAAGDAGGDALKLAEELKTLNEIISQVNKSTASPEQKDLQDASDLIEKVNSLHKVGAEQRTAVVEQIWAAFYQRQQQRRDAEQAQSDQAEQQRLQKVHEFEDQLRSAQVSGYEKAEEELRQHLNKIYELTTGADGDTMRLTILANGEYLAAIDKLNAEDLRRDVEAAQQREKLLKEERQKEINDAIAAANTMVQVSQLVDQGKLSRAFLPDPAYVQQVIAQIKKQLQVLYSQPIVDDKQIQEITKLQEALEKLNKLNLSPFMKVLQQLKDNMQQIGTQVTQAWSQFWSDLASGQANAGKKFLAALIDTIAQQLEIMAVNQVAQAIAAAADLDFAGAARHAAAAAGLAALGGVLQGFASSLSQSQSAAASVPAAPATGGSSTPTNTNPATMSVGASGGPQNAGAAAAPTKHVVELQITPTNAFVVKTTRQNIEGNGELRTVIKKAVNG